MYPAAPEIFPLLQKIISSESVYFANRGIGCNTKAVIFLSRSSVTILTGSEGYEESGEGGEESYILILPSGKKNTIFIVLRLSLNLRERQKPRGRNITENLTDGGTEIRRWKFWVTISVLLHFW